MREWNNLDPTLWQLSTWNELLEEEESSPLLKLFKTSQGSSQLVRNAFCKGLGNPLLLIQRWQGKGLFFLTGYLHDCQEVWIYRWIFCFVQSTRETPQVGDLKVNMGTKRASSWQGTESIFNTAGSPWTLKVLSGK